ncbi:5-fold beta-flower protein [Streptomyces sp. B21-097]|uniref:5-fold beta-flower protein n=1 Tax=Streptomyces sp. B21-097 TaxID=3039414 RepID=UPI003FA7A59A
MSYIKDTRGNVVGYFSYTGTVSDTSERSRGRVDWKGSVYDTSDWCVGRVSSIGRVVDGSDEFAGKVEGSTVYDGRGYVVASVDAATSDPDPFAVTEAQRAGAGLLLLLTK